MARRVGRLNALAVSRVRQPGMYADGGGLYLQVTSAEARSWVFRYARDGRERFMGPETSMEVQAALGSDIALVFDECTPFHVTRDYTARSTERTHRWLERCLDWLHLHQCEANGSGS